MARKLNSQKGRSGNGNGANLGFEQTLWLAADKMRNNMDAAEYKHVVLGLIFLKYISDAFEEMHQRLLAQQGEGADPEDADEYRAQNVFWVPQEARWEQLQAKAKQPSIGKLVDAAMDAIERDNPTLKGVLPKQYARPSPRQAAARGTHRPHRHHRAGRCREPIQGHPGPRLRILPCPIRQRARVRRAGSSTRPAAWSIGRVRIC